MLLLGSFGSAGTEATGGTITTYSSGGKTYRAHTFTSGSSIVFTSVAGPVDYIIVGPGGGGSAAGFGGDGAGSGGGTGGSAGAFNSGTFTPLVQSYSITVGTGGAGGTGIRGAGSAGSGATTFNSISSIEGGGGSWTGGFGSIGPAGSGTNNVSSISG